MHRNHRAVCVETSVSETHRLFADNMLIDLARNNTFSVYPPLARRISWDALWGLAYL